MTKSTRRRSVSIVVIAVMIISISSGVIVTKGTSLSDLAAILISAISVLAVFVEIRKNGDVAKGGFIINLQEKFETNTEGVAIFIECWENTNVINLDGRHEAILNYLTFFESMYVMVDNGVLTIEMLDELFGRRFFAFVNRLEIQEVDLAKNYMFYLNIYELHARWRAYRQKKHNAVLFSIDDPNSVMDTKERFRDLSEALKEVDFGKYCEIYGKCGCICE